MATSKQRKRVRSDDGGWRPLLRRADQATVAGLVVLALAGMATYWVV